MCRRLSRKWVLFGFFLSASMASPLASAQISDHPPIQVFRPTFEPGSPEIPPPGEPPGTTHFGAAVAIRDETALVGMPRVLDDTGAVNIFVRATSGAWPHRGTLRASDAAPGSLFGKSLAFRDNIAVVGAERAAYVFRRDGQAWKQILKLTPPAGQGVTDFARSLDYQDGTVVVGANRMSGPDNVVGAVYVYQIESSGRFLSRVRITPFDSRSGDQFGTDVGMTHDTIVVGAPFAGSGAAYVYKRRGIQWIHWQKLISADIDPTRGGFGSAVAIDRNMIVVGAPHWHLEGDFFGVPTPDGHHAGGAAYVFTVRAGLYREQQKLRPTPDQIFSFDRFGSTIAMFNTRVAVTGRDPIFGVSITPLGFAVTYARAADTLTPLGLASTSTVPESISIRGNWLLLGSPIDTRCPFGCIGRATLFDMNRIQ